MIKVTINSQVHSLSDYFIITDFVIDSPSFSYYTEKIDYRLGEIVGGQTLNKRNLSISGYIKGDYINKRNKILKLFATQSLILTDTRDATREWIVYPSKVDIKQETDNFGEVSIELTSYDGYSKSAALKSTTSNSANFSVTNNGDLTIDPRVHQLRFEFTGTTSTSFTVTNTTTNESVVFNTPMAASNTIAIDRIHYEKDGALITSKTNKKLISLVPGVNNFTITGLSSPAVKIFYYEYYL